MSRKLPALTDDNRAFWQGGEQGRLLIHHCQRCARFFHPPSPMCPRCTSFDVAARPVCGKGSVASFTINHQQWTPGLEVPFVVAIVELIEQPGLRFVSNIVGCDPQSVAIGMRVKVIFEHHEDVWIPLFEKDQ
ncbi:Zn-ribbon domain-containing OB-fold protein [Pseudomonas sp. NPDC087358]|uniref:Zn-ribbon domain-containing OB-fold protein n=1 Tax=Pseudomonas sp. NPDC087358 TaxID=3364439 RepID=UPI00384F741A